MKLFKSFMLLLLVFVVRTVTVHAQSTIVPAGGSATGAGGSISISVGQINNLNKNNNSGAVSEGVQQVYQIYSVATPTGKGFDIEATAYPNPTSDIIYIRIDKGKIENLKYIIRDEIGKTIKEKAISGTETMISLKELRNSFYFLDVYKINLLVKSFKIVKTQ